jgi:hypothetical protein
MKIKTPLVLLFFYLAACAPVVTPISTEHLIPSAVAPTSTPTVGIPSIATPSPMPTQPSISMITPDAIQVERWKEYETALAKTIFPSSFIPGKFLCEWEILGQAGQEEYVWVKCTSIFLVGVELYLQGEIPAVIHVRTDGSIQSVEFPGGGTDYARDIRRMFPPYAYERYFSRLINFQELIDHLHWRREHPEEPPLVVLSATPTP